MTPVRRIALAAALLTPMVGLTAPATAELDPVGSLTALLSPDALPVDPAYALTELPGIVSALAADRSAMLACPELAGGTAGLPEPGDRPAEVDAGNPLRAGDATDAPATLPRQVVLRSERETFNRRYQFVLSGGRVWFKSNTAVTGIREPWARLPLSRCFDGHLVGISVDDDELVAIDDDRQIYTMDGALGSPSSFNWTMRWGIPFWTGPGWQLPTGIQDWEWSVVSKREEGTFRDAAGNQHAVGDGKVSHIWTLSDSGRRLTYLDPWLPNDSSFEMCAPHRGRFRSVSLAASGSTVFVIGKYGDLFTRLYDFDMAGADPIFFRYSYADQRGVANPAIQLPSPGWVRQPKIPGVITDRISIHKVGSGTDHRVLRVEGRSDGRTGYWQKDISARAWRFVPTYRTLTGTRLENPTASSSARGLLPSEDRAYSGSSNGARLTVPDFNTYCSPSRLKVALPTGESFTLTLHTVDIIRQTPRARGLDTNPRRVEGTLSIPDALRTGDPEIAAFVNALGPGRFVQADMDATTGTLTFPHRGWTLTLQ